MNGCCDQTERVIRTSRRVVGIGATLLTLAIIIGAFGAHGLKGVLPPSILDIYEKGVFYQVGNSLGVVLVGALLAGNVISTRIAKLVSTILTIGVVLFSGSLYVYSVTGERLFAMITPFGGVSFMLGWAVLALSCFKGKKA